MTTLDEYLQERAREEGVTSNGSSKCCCKEMLLQYLSRAEVRHRLTLTFTLLIDWNVAIAMLYSLSVTACDLIANEIPTLLAQKL